jgi:hypothetical protein
VHYDEQHCPPDAEEIAEAYCMDTLDRAQRIAFEDHYFACARCASIVTDTNVYIRAMKTALRRLRPTIEARKVMSASAGAPGDD